MKHLLLILAICGSIFTTKIWAVAADCYQYSALTDGNNIQIKLDFGAWSNQSDEFGFIETTIYNSKHKIIDQCESFFYETDLNICETSLDQIAVFKKRCDD